MTVTAIESGVTRIGDGIARLGSLGSSRGLQCLTYPGPGHDSWY